MAKKPSKPATAAPVELTLPKGTILALPGSMAHARCLQQSIDHYQRKFEAGDNLAWLQAVDDDMIVVEVDGSPRRIPTVAITAARTVADWTAELRRSSV